MEVTGLAVGVVGLAGLFSVCLDSLSRFHTYRESNSETHVLDTRFRAARARFEQWGVSVGISNGRLQPDHHLGLDNRETANLIESILQIIAKTICDESILQRSRTGLQSQSEQLGSLSQSRGKRLKWAFGGKESRHEQVDIFEKLVQQLYNLILPEEKSHNYEGLESTAWVEDIRQMLTKIEEGIKSEMQRDVLSWLGKSATDDKYEDSLAKRVDTTCEWIFERPTFKSWLSPLDPTKPNVLWINGPAGFGKTILGAHIVYHLSQALDTPVAHFFSGHAQLLKFILQNGPRSLATDHVSRVGSPLILVACNGDIDMASILFEFGAVSSLFRPASNGVLPLQLAASLGHIELVELFLEHGAARTLSIPNAAGNTALHLACDVTGRDKVISLLLRPGVEESILMRNQEGNTPLHIASSQGHASYVNMILQYSEPGHQRLLEIQNTKLETPLYLASGLGNIVVVRELLNFGAQKTFSVHDEARRTPLFIAALKGYVDVVKTLLQYGAESTFGIFDVCDNSPLWAASIQRFSEVVKELLSHGAGRTITDSNSEGETPLHAAVIANDVEALKLLLEVPGVPVNQKTTYGFSPLFIASRNGCLSMVELLLSVDSVDRDSENWLGLGPLFTAVANGHLEVTKLLLSKGCHVQHRVSIGRDLLWWAQRSNTPDLIQLLQTQEPLDGTASDSCNSDLPGTLTSLGSLSRDAETVHCTPGISWCYVCTLSVRDDQIFHCVECDDSYMYLCAECFTRGFQLCLRSHSLSPSRFYELDGSINADGSVDLGDI